LSEGSWRNLAIGLAVVLVFLAAAAVGSIVGGGRAPAATSGPGSSLAIGSGSPAASASGASAGASVALSSEASAGASGGASPSASSTPSPSPTKPPAPAAKLAFRQLTLDARGAPNANARFITFTSDGPGTISAKLTTDSSPGTTHMCLRVGSTDLTCKDWTGGTITFKTTSTHGTWRVSLEGNGTATPTVDLTVTFPSLKPLVKITHARFDGTAFPDYNGIQVTVVPRTAGKMTLAANWGGHNFVYEIDLMNQTSGSGSQTLANQGPAPSASTSLPVTAAETWKLVLQNVETGIGVTGMTASIGWP
jgi:hypothetical protein